MDPLSFGLLIAMIISVACLLWVGYTSVREGYYVVGLYFLGLAVLSVYLFCSVHDHVFE